jgi:hypothetical protein
MLSNNGEEETSVGATIDENSEASSRDAASTSGLEEHETVDPPDDEVLPVHPAHDPLGYLSGPRPDFDIDQDTHPFDETELSQEGSCQSVSEAVNRVGGAVEVSLQIQNFRIRDGSHHILFDHISVEIRKPRAQRMRAPQRRKTETTPRSPHRITVLRRQLLQVTTIGNIMAQKTWGRYVHKILA